MSSPARERNTRQKEIVESVVLGACDHPTAETVCLRARRELPDISLGTVYRILKNMVRAGSVREISVPGASSRFDKTAGIHAHFVCSVCGGVSDVDMCESAVFDEVAGKNPEYGFSEAEIVFKGICPECGRKNEFTV